MMNTAKQFGETVEGYNIPVLNEREIRASAGILFLFMFISWMLIIFKENYLLIKYVNTIFLTDFIIRLLINPKFAPSLIAGRLIVRRQNPEYVGAIQKKFAWTIGLVLASAMFLLMVVINSYGLITSLVCLICLTFLFFESAFGICLGCSLYGFLYKEKTQYCPGEICEVETRREIQKTSSVQNGILIGLLPYVLTIAFVFNNWFSVKPTHLWIILKSILAI